MARVYQSKSMDSSVTDAQLSATSKSLASLGISVRDATNNYIPFNTLMQEVADKEKGLTDSQKANIAYNAAGVIFCSL